jgi:hypothetical protein
MASAFFFGRSWLSANSAAICFIVKVACGGAFAESAFFGGAATLLAGLAAFLAGAAAFLAGGMAISMGRLGGRTLLAPTGFEQRHGPVIVDTSLLVTRWETLVAQQVFGLCQGWRCGYHVRGRVARQRVGLTLWIPFQIGKGWAKRPPRTLGD